MLSRDEATTYLTDILQMSNVEDKIKVLDLSFVNEITHRHNLVNPFNNVVRFLSIDEADRCIPSLSEIKTSMFARLGGLCYEHGVFLNCLFGELGYKVELYLAAVLHYPPAHVLTVVSIGEEKQEVKYLVDAGFGTPFFQAVPLNFKQESTVYHNAYYRFKYYRRDDKIVHTILPRQYAGQEAGTEESKDMYSFEPTAMTREEIVDVHVGNLYRYDDEKKFSEFHCHLALIGFHEGQGYRLMDHKYELEESDGLMKVHKFESYKERKAVIKKYCPQLDDETLQRALDYLKVVEKRKILKTILTRNEAIHYLEDILLIKDVHQKLTSLNDDFLDEIVKTHIQTVPFTSMDLLSTAPADRSLPSTDLVKKNMFEKTGGLCFVHNTFMFYLLQALSYDVKFCMASVDSRPLNHPVVMVTIQDGDHKVPYLVDVATGYPMFQAVPLDFEEESPVYKNAYLSFKYIKKDGKILRLNGTGNLHPDRKGLTHYLQGWRVYYEFEMVEVTQNFVDDRSREVYLYDPEAKSSPFHVSHRTLAYPDGKCIGFKDDMFITEEDAKLVFTKMDGIDDIKHKILTHFPQYSVNMIDGMLENWRKENRAKLL